MILKVSLKIKIKLNRTYTNKEKYTLYFSYTSKPNDIKAEGSAAITDAKGLYFIKSSDGKNIKLMVE